MPGPYYPGDSGGWVPYLRRFYRANLGGFDYLDEARFITQAREQDRDMVETNPDEACLVSSRSANWLANSLHYPTLDMDFPIELRESSPGRFHLFLNRAITWENYVRLLEVLRDVGLVERGFANSSIARGASYLRVAPRGERETVDWDRPQPAPQPAPLSDLFEFVRDDGPLPTPRTSTIPDRFDWGASVNQPVGAVTQSDIEALESELDLLWARVRELENNGTTCECLRCNPESVGQADAPTGRPVTSQWGSGGISQTRPVEGGWGTNDRQGDSIVNASPPGYPGSYLVGGSSGVRGDSSDERSEAGPVASDGVDRYR